MATSDKTKKLQLLGGGFATKKQLEEQYLKTYVLDEGETVEDAPEWAEEVVDPYSESEGLKPTYSGGNLQIGNENISIGVDWNHTDGAPEDKGLTFSGTAGTSVLQDNGLLLSPGAEYKPPLLSASSSVMECVFVIPTFATYQYGFLMQLTNGTKGIRISCYLNQLRYNNNTSNNITVANLETNTEYTLRIEWDDTTGADVYLNGERVITGGSTVYTLGENMIRQTHSGTTLLKSVSFQCDAEEVVEISTINGAGVCDKKAREELDALAKIVETFIDGVQLIDKRSGDAYDIYVIDGKLTMEKVESEG